MNISITGIGTYIPCGRISNKDMIEHFRDEFSRFLEAKDLEYLMYGLERKMSFLEIETRTCCESYEKENSVTMAVSVAEKALRNAGISASDIDLLLFTGVTNPLREPSYAILLAHKLGIKEVNCFDVNDTCNGFLKCLELADLYIQAQKAKRVLVVTSESTLEWMEAVKENFQVKTVEDADRLMSALFCGSGAAAMVLEKNNGKHVIQAYKEKTSTEDWDISFLVSPLMQIPVKQISEEKRGICSDGRKIAATIIRDMPEFVEEFLRQQTTSIEQIRYIFSHQLGRNITFALLNKLKVDIDKVFPVNTFKEYGNMGSANIPVGLGIAEEQGILKSGDSILLLGSSCGIKYTCVNIIW